MGKPRIIVTCPETGIAAITTIAYEDMIDEPKKPRLFSCPCGEMHEITYAGRHGGPARKTQLNRYRAS
ncbi:MAG: hypothetical protein K9G60_08595 [Pseudolabrys sp.]|nr:hypothetical protein [Pseudolabrys sp.]